MTSDLSLSALHSHVNKTDHIANLPLSQKMTSSTYHKSNTNMARIIQGVNGALPTHDMQAFIQLSTDTQEQ